MRSKILLPVIALFTFLPFFATAAEPLRITRMTPSGENVGDTKQIVIQFNRNVVPLGRMERDASELPITIEPALECQWRWLNPSALACNLDNAKAAKPATSYTVRVNVGITAEDGATIAEPYTASFNTIRPQIYSQYFRAWEGPGNPILRVQFNQPVTQNSVVKSVHFRTVFDEKTYRFRAKVSAPTQNYETETPVMVGHEEARYVWMLSPEHSLPLDSTVELRVIPGLVPAQGMLKGNETRTAVTFDTFPRFAFAGISCSTNDNIRITLPAEAVKGKCSPMKPLSLDFTAPVAASQVRDFVAFTPDLAGGRKDYDPWANSGENFTVTQPHTKGRIYSVFLPERLKALQSYTISSKPPALSWWERFMAYLRETRKSDMRDAFGRILSKPFSLTFTTDSRPPNYVLASSRYVLESGVDSDVPLYVTNLEKATLQFSKLAAGGGITSGSHDVPFNKSVKNLQFAVPLGIRGILGDKSGLVAGSLTTSPIVHKHPAPVFAQVTPFAVHAKLGHFNTLVWVTDMKTGQPVEGAKVSIYKAKERLLTTDYTALDRTNTGKDGIALLKGNESLDPELDSAWCYGETCENLIVRVDTPEGMAYLPLLDDYQVNSWRVSGNQIWEDINPRYGHIDTWGTTAQGVYRVGDTMQYKLFVRNQDNNRYVPPPAGKYTLEITDPLGNSVFKKEGISLSEFGTYAGEYAIPASAPLGWYDFILSGDFTTQDTWQPMRVLVTDFTPSPFKVRNSLNGDLFRAGDSIEVDTQATLHSGGAYTDADLRVTAELAPRSFTSKDKLAEGFFFDTYQSDSSDLFSVNARIDDKGTNLTREKLPETDIIYGRLSVESAVRDDRGKYVASQSQADYIGVDRLVGLKNTAWMFNAGKPAIVKTIVVDEKGKPVSGTKITLLVERQETKASRVKGAGNAYLTQYTEEWVKAAECNPKSSATQAQDCTFTPDKPGSYRATASISDTDGKPHSTSTYLWVVGKGDVVWHSKDDSALDIVAEKPAYAIGDTANFLVKNPYPDAQALVTIERYGVLKQWVQKLEGSTPTISFPVERDFMPGFYLSVVVMSPRVEAAPPTFGQVDLGKPAFRIGYTKIDVQDNYKLIDVTAKTDAEVYKPASEVQLSLHAELRHKDVEEPIEIAVAVLDEAVLDLVPNGRNNYDPYKGFFSLDGLDLTNYNLLRQLVGRQYFEKKGANPGGDGGADLAMRTNFKFVSYWNPSIKTDAEGNANVNFTLPDNLTGWRVLAFAVTPTDRMGLGDVAFKVNQPTEIRPVMPNQVTEGDSFRAGFSVMNRTDAERTLKVSLSAKGALKNGDQLQESTITLAPYKRETVYVNVETAALPAERENAQGEITFTVSAEDANDGDATRHSVPVHKRRGLDVSAAYGTTTEGEVSQTIAFPAGIHTDVGDVSAVLSPTVIGNVEGAFRYMRDYPYTCWEQKLTKGVMAANYTRLKDYMPDGFTWEDSEQIAPKVLSEAASFQAPNGGMAYFSAQNEYVSPYLSAYTALGFQWLKANGHDVPRDVEQKLQAYLQTLLRQDAVPTFYSEGMTATVRAVALAALAAQDKLPLADVERFAPHMPRMSLFGKAMFLQAAHQVKGAENIARDTATAIYATSNQTGGKFLFSETLDDSYTRIHATPLRENCAILSAISTYAIKPENREFVGDTPFKLVRSITQSRGNRDHWENTQENIFCMQALADYAKAFEADKPAMSITAQLDDKPMGKAAFASVKDKTATLSLPITPEDPGTTKILHIEREGSGRLYYSARLRYAPLADNAADVNSGIELHKEYSVEREGKWTLLTNKAEVKQGELVRVDLFVSVPAARHFVVVDDPVPGGLEPVNRDLATSSKVDSEKGDYAAAGGSFWFKFSDWNEFGSSRWNFYHREIGHKAVRFYADYLPAGNYRLSYTAQAIASGSFTQMPALAAEMYDPDVYGKSTPGTLTVTPE